MKYRVKYKKKKAVVNFYEKDASAYDAERSSTFEGRQVDSLQASFLCQLIRKHKPKTLLEAGCGTGRILHRLVKGKKIKAVGIDPSENMLAQFRKKLKGKNENITLKKASIEKLPFKDNSFDLVYTMHVLMHLPEHKKAISEMFRVTKKGGVMVCDFPNYHSPWTKLALLMSPGKKRTQLFTRRRLEALFSPYNHVQYSGIFSYARSFYRIPVLNRVFASLEARLPLPVNWRGQYFVIVKK